MNFSFNVWNYEVMNLSISRSYCEFQLIIFYVSWDIADKRRKPHLLDRWHSSPQHLLSASSWPGIVLGKERIPIRIIINIYSIIVLLFFVYLYIYIHIYLSIYRSIDLSVYLSNYLSIYLSISLYLSIYIYIYIHIYIYIYIHTNIYI